MAIYDIPNIKDLKNTSIHDNNINENYYCDKYRDSIGSKYISPSKLRPGYIFWTSVGYQDINTYQYIPEERKYLTISTVPDIQNPGEMLINFMPFSHSGSEGDYLASYDLPNIDNVDINSKLQISRIYQLSTKNMASKCCVDNYDISEYERQKLIKHVLNQHDQLMNDLNQKGTSIIADPSSSHHFLTILPRTNYIARIDSHKLKKHMSISKKVKELCEHQPYVDNLSPNTIQQNKQLVQQFGKISPTQVSQLLAFPKQKRFDYPQITDCIMHNDLTQLQSFVDNNYTFPDDPTIKSPIISNATTPSSTNKHKKKHHKAKHKTNDGPDL